MYAVLPERFYQVIKMIRTFFHAIIDGEVNRPDFVAICFCIKYLNLHKCLGNYAYYIN